MPPHRRELRPVIRRIALIAWALLLLALVGAVAVKAFAPLVLTTWDLLLRDQPGQMSIFNAAAEGGYWGMPVEIADYDGDGRPDLALAPMAAPSGANHERTSAGEVYVYPGDGKIGGTLDRKAMGSRPLGLTVWGARQDDFLGTELFSADVNGDGIADLIIGAQNYDGPDGKRDNAGGAFVILGRPGLLASEAPGGGPLVIDLLDPPPGVITIVGRKPGERAGIWVEAGDLDGDGMADILIGSDQAAGAADPPQPHAGLVAVVYGRRDFPAVIDLADAGAATGAELGISLIFGKDPEDHFGSCLHARDLDRDGLPELIASAAINRLSATYGGSQTAFPSHGSGGGDGPTNHRPESGEVYVIFSNPAQKRLPPVVDLRQPGADFQERLTTIYGQWMSETCGEEIATGDLNGDGYPDLILGALAQTNPLGHTQSGAAYLFYWGPGLRGLELDLIHTENFPAALVYSVIEGYDYEDILGDTLSVGDFNHDGIDDLAVTIPHASFPGRFETGEVAILYGQHEPFPKLFYPSHPGGENVARISFVIGANSGDLLGYSMEARDYDGDGYTDLFPNAMRGDGAQEDALDAGEAYLLSGFYLSGARLEVTGVDPDPACLGIPLALTVMGNGFTRDDETRVLIDGVPLEQVHVLSATRITCLAPARSASGDSTVAVENRYGHAELAAALHYPPDACFLRSDSDGNGKVLINDPIVTLNFLFLGIPASCLDGMDANDDGSLDVTDPIFTLQFLFSGGDGPPAPYPSPGADPTPDKLDCAP